jgi:CheY-like chemotaxis protein
MDRVPVVLVADDDDALRETTTLLLEEEGYGVLTARDGEEALREVRDARPDAVLLDMMMPAVDGLQFLDRLPREGAGCTPVVIAYSGFGRLEELARSHGASAFLPKPVDAAHLLGALAALLADRALSPSAIAASERSHRRAVADADRRRAEIIARTDLANPAFRAQLRQLVEWLTGYFSAELAVIGLVHLGRILILARSGTDEFGEDALLDPDSSYCPDVARASTPLIVRETSDGTPFCDHPAASTTWPYYAGAPLLGDGISAGTLCLRGSRPFPIQAEDMVVLSHFARLVGGSIREGALVAPDLFRAPALLSIERFPILLESALLRAERDRGAVALAIVEATGVERLGMAIQRAAGARYLALAALGAGRAAILVEGRGADEARARAAAGTSAVTVAGAGASITVTQPGREAVNAARFLRAALTAPCVAIPERAGAPDR